MENFVGLSWVVHAFIFKFSVISTSDKPLLNCLVTGGPRGTIDVAGMLKTADVAGRLAQFGSRKNFWRENSASGSKAAPKSCKNTISLTTTHL